MGSTGSLTITTGGIGNCLKTKLGNVQFKSSFKERELQDPDEDGLKKKYISKIAKYCEYGKRNREKFNI